MWNKFRRPMLRSRVVSEGVRTVFPAATSGFYEPGEVQDFDDKPVKKMKDVTPAKPEPVLQDEVIDWKAFGKEFSDGLKKCTSLEELEDLKTRYSDKLLLMATAWPDGFAKIEINIEKAVKNLAPAEDTEAA